MPRNGLICIGLIALILGGGAIRARTVFTHPLWFDEADTWRASVMDPRASSWDEATGLVKVVPMGYDRFFAWTNHFETAPLTFLLARISTDIAGTDAEWAMRIPSLIAGILCIPAAFMLGRIIQGPLLGLIVAALVAFDPSAVDQSRQARMYSLMLLLTLVALAWAIRLVRATSRQGGAGPTLANGKSVQVGPHPSPLPEGEGAGAIWHWIGLGVTLGLLLCSSQFTTAVWIGLALGVGGLLLLGKFTGQPHPRMMKVAGGLTLAYIVGLAVANIGVVGIVQRVLFGGPGDGAHLSMSDIAREIAAAAKDLIHLTSAGLIVYPLAALGMVLLLKRCKTSTAILAGVAIVNILVLFPFRKMHHFLDGRYLMVLQPALFVGLAMLAVGFQSQLLRRMGAAIVLVYVGLQMWQSSVKLDAYPQQPDRYLFTRQIIDVKNNLKPGETVSIYPGVAVQLGMYYRVKQDVSLVRGLYDPVSGMPMKAQTVPADLRDRVSAVWLVMGMYNYEEKGETKKAERVEAIRKIADHYGVKASRADLDKHLKQQRITTVRISKEGVNVTSVGLDD